VSAQLKSFEGPDVQRLLDQIRTEMGPDVTINGAEKVRVGGVLGYCAKEQYPAAVRGVDVAAWVQARGGVVDALAIVGRVDPWV